MTDAREQPLTQFNLNLINCDKCNNTGWINRVDENGFLISTECDCMNQRRTMRHIKKSNLFELYSRYTFKEYQTPTQAEEQIKLAAATYCKAKPAWFYISGKTGSGKTHICTAMFFNLMRQGEEGYYLKWREDLGEIKSWKAAKNPPPELDKKMKYLERVPLLYIDDFFKGSVSKADAGIAFEIINSRYNAPSKRTIISSELSIDQINRVDEAIGGRILERARGFVITTPAKNWRLTG